MSADAPLAEVEMRSGPQAGSRLTLYPNRLVHAAPDLMETMPLAHVAAVGVAFERDPRKLNWAVILVVLALMLIAVSGPLRDGLGGLAARIAEPGRRESLDAVLVSVFGALGSLARLLAPIGGLLLAWAAALAVFFWLGVTSLRLSFAANEREFQVRGRNQPLHAFADSVAEQLATRKP